MVNHVKLLTFTSCLQIGGTVSANIYANILSLKPGYCFMDVTSYVCVCVGSERVTSDLLVTATAQKVKVVLRGQRLQRLWPCDFPGPGGVVGRHLQDVVKAAVSPVVRRRLQTQHI